MSVSRDFIDSYSPEAPSVFWNPGPCRHRRGPTRSSRQAAIITLVFGFRVAEDLIEPPVALGQGAGFVLALAQELLQGPMERDGLVHLRAGARRVGAQPEQFLHVGIGGQ